MKRYTLRAAIHDAKVFNQLRAEYLQFKRSQRKDLCSGWLLRYWPGVKGTRAGAAPLSF
ncbi:MAG TPA: hypothetical protein VFQ78_15000 [Candidatus Udaeobacter sp.]|jgi:hypothetical protein|nr:hypothetical protein [Candidatus Udaeobacter sp.]